jgi:sporadic carbohydrate cluster protein (TIGR04323 family)
MKKKFAGYINLKPLNGIIYPSSIQNILMKNFIENNLGGIFYLSPTEVLQAKFSVTLETLISKETKVSGIVMLSTFLLPKSFKERKSMYKKLLTSKKKMYFIFDELALENKKDIRKIENFIIFNDNHFTNTKKKLNTYENLIMKKYRDVSFV